MKRFNIEDYAKGKDGRGVAIHLPTYESALIFANYMQASGYGACGGLLNEGAIDMMEYVNDHWERYENDTCIGISKGVTYCSKQYYEKHWDLYTVIEFDDFDWNDIAAVFEISFNEIF